MQIKPSQLIEDSKRLPHGGRNFETIHSVEVTQSLTKIFTKVICVDTQGLLYPLGPYEQRKTR